MLTFVQIYHPARPFSEKTSFGTNVLIAAFISNCKAAGANQRFEYLQELMKHIPVCVEM